MRLAVMLVNALPDRYVVSDVRLWWPTEATVVLAGRPVSVDLRQVLRI